MKNSKQYLSDGVPAGIASRGLAATLVVVVSKTFTTAETMLNARTVKAWIVAGPPPMSPSDARR